MDEHTTTPAPHQAKRIKIRKGTRSSWECKRRKVSCKFQTARDSTCLNCFRRNVPCVSQSMPEKPSPSSRHTSRHLDDRITKVEDFIQSFLTNSPRPTPASASGNATSSTQSAAYAGDAAQPNRAAPPTPADSLVDAATVSSLLLHDAPYPEPSGHTDTNATALHHLYAAFPTHNDAMLLLRDSHRVALYTDLVNMQPHSKLTREALTSPRRPVQLPLRATTHPVTLARLMLTFAITLQSPSGHQIAGLCKPQGVLMRRLMAAATTRVTTKQDMHTSIDSLACILPEAAYEINCGHLRRAWAVYRRAMTVAQLMGLHRPNIGPVQRIDDQDDADPEFMWFRIVYMDRYLSLLLGLPQGTPDKSIGPAATLRQEPPLGKFERLLTVIASRILDRNERPFHLDDSVTTKSIDDDLLSVSRAMPSSFWRPISFHGLSPGSPDTLLETVRLSAHVYYYSLLIQLHLPYMVQGIAANSPSDDDYSKTTSVNASREIIMRFIAHRTFNPKSSCSRPVDFFALLASMTLILAHLNTRNHPAAAKHPAHQRSTDRALLDQTLERVQFINSLNSHDAVYENSAVLIHSLLQIEALGDDCYITDRSNEIHLDAEQGQLHLQIPYIGRIKITRQNPTVMREASQYSPLGPGLPAPAQHSSSNAVFQTPPQQTDGHLRRHPYAPPPNAGNSEGLSIVEQSSTFAQAPDVYTASSTQYSPVNQDTPFVQQQQQQQQQQQRQHMAHFGLQGADGVDDWTLEGVEMAFFANLLRGAT